MNTSVLNSKQAPRTLRLFLFSLVPVLRNTPGTPTDLNEVLSTYLGYYQETATMKRMQPSEIRWFLMKGNW